MKKSILSSLFLFIIASAAVCQTGDKYYNLIDQAHKYYQNKSYKLSANTYSKAFASNGWKGYRVDRYDAACAWTMAGNKDSAFYQLFKVADAFKYDNYEMIAHDSVLTSLYKDQRWEQVLKLVRNNIGSEEAKLNKTLLRLMDSVYHDDQAYRFQQISIDREFGPNSEKSIQNKHLIFVKDSVNERIVSNLLDQYGWLGQETVGINGNATLALVLQHSSLHTQKKYLPLMREAVKNKKSDANDLALLEDLTALKDGQKQIYGTYLIASGNKKYYIAPIEDPSNVDLHRAEIGLSSLDEYLRNWGMRWNLKQYQEDLKVIPENIRY
jgi:hypothetical protein